MIGISEELKNTDPDLLSPLTLAFIGDTVFDLLVRGNPVSYTHLTLPTIA